MIRWFSLFLLAFQLLQPDRPAHPAADSVTFTNSAPTVSFGASIDFQVHLASSSTIQKIFVSIAPQGRDAAFYPMQLSPQGDAVYHLDLTRHPLRAFSQVSYYYRASLSTGEDIDSQTYQFDYTDLRFEWKDLQNQAFHVFWYDREVDFGQTALNTAQSGLEAAAKLVPALPQAQIRVYIYSSLADLQNARQGLQPWVAGHASPDLHLILVSVPPGPSQRLELERQLPHEITHIFQYDAYGDRAKDLPIWLLEGTASVSELYPNSDYDSVLQAAIAQNQLLPLASLCSEFPRDASGAFLAYAQSQSFVRFLYRKFGSSGLQLLFEQYHNGLGCTQGIQAALNVALPELEYRWRLEELGINPAALIVQNLLPYFILLFILLGAASLAILISSRRRKAPAHAR